MFNYSEFRSRLRSLSDPESTGDVYQKILIDKKSVAVWFFNSDRFEFLNYVYHHILNRPADPHSMVYMPILDRPFGRIFVLGCVGASREAQAGNKRNRVLYPIFKSIEIAKSFYDKFNKLALKFSKSINSDEDDAFYAKFEEKFRGNTQDIIKILKSRYSSFIPDPCGIERAVDIGCGRCEFVEILNSRGYTTTGVDINSLFVEHGTSKTLDIRKRDALKFLKSLEDNSISLISSLHLIEHFHLIKMKIFFKEIYRVLKPGGTLILETPNARNLLVSGGDFYRDPTHVNPIFPDTLDLILKYNGFEGEYYFFNEDQSAIMGRNIKFESLDDYLHVSRDLAWVGKKASTLGQQIPA